MKNIGDVMQKIFANSNIHNEFKKHQIIHYWPKIVGEKLAQFSYIDNIENKTLYVVVTNAPWMQQIKMQSNIILRRVNDFYGQEIVKIVRFKSGRMLPKIKLEEEHHDWDEKFPFSEAKVNPKFEEKLDERLKNMENLKLKNALKNLAINIVKREAFLKQAGIENCPICKTYKDKNEKVCTICRHKLYRKEIGRIKSYILQYPDNTYNELNAKYKCTKDDFYIAKNEVMQKYKTLNNCKEPSMEIMYMFTMLYTGKTREELTDDYVKSYTAKYRRYYD